MTHGHPISDRVARERIRTGLDESLIVEAAAGTGKTSELVRRIVSVLRTGRASVDRIVAVTFTRKAAGELKLRLRQELDRNRGIAPQPEEKHRLEAAMVRLEEAHIGTIHSFCADILREHPVEAAIQPGFEELDEAGSRQLFDRVFNRWAQQAMDDPSPGLTRALERASDWDNSRTPLQRIQREAWTLVEWRDFPTPWRRGTFDRGPQIDGLIDAVHDLAHMALDCSKRGDVLQRALEPAVLFSARLRRQEGVRRRDYDDLEAGLVRLLRDLLRDRRKGRGTFSAARSREQVLGARQTMIQRLESFKRAADADLAASLRHELMDLVVLYNDSKRHAGKVDFADLLISTRNLLRFQTSTRLELQHRFTHIFVDEFQDTDPLQAEILLLLSADDPQVTDAWHVRPVPGKLFLVGDPKQSIYRFRRADFNIYRALRESLLSKGVGLVRLTSSFRSVPDIQRVVNAAFQSEMAENVFAAQPGYIPLGEQSPRIEGQPAVIALPLARPYGWRTITKGAIKSCLPDTTAAWIEWLLAESRWRVRNPSRPADLIPVAPRHIAILFRRFLSWGEDVTRDYVHALESRNIPHLLQGARSFHQREEVETLRAALAAIEWPDDELAVFATLKGSLFAIPDEQLFTYHETFGSLHPFRPAPAGLAPGLSEVQSALEALACLHRKRNARPFVETINDLLTTCRAHAGFALRPAGNQVLANVYRVGDLARRFDSMPGMSFRGFVEQLIREASGEDPGESPVLEEGADGVRVMTVHAAKGLEFPVVLLADITANMASTRPDKHVDPDRGLAALRLLGCAPWELNDNEQQEHVRDRSEGVRIAYVAATRARDILVVPTVGDGPVSGWTETLNPALYPPASSTWMPDAPGCPRFGNRSVLERPVGVTAKPNTSVRPGLYHSDTGDYDVVWWDPSLLNLNQNASFGILQEHILTAEQSAGTADRSVSDYTEWRSRRNGQLRDGCVRSVDVFSPSQTDVPPPDAGLTVDVEILYRPADRPSGPRFGSLVHLLLHDGWDRRDDEAGLMHLSVFHGRILDATIPEREASVAIVRAAFRHPLLERAAMSFRCYREYPVTCRTSDGRILDGVIDLLFEENSAWHVVDFKTDHDPGPLLERYKAQVGWYVHAVSQITGQPVSGHILGV